MALDSQPGSRVLVADDDHAIRQLVCTIVRREKLDVDCVADGDEAIELIAEKPYSVIILDLMMPRTDGFAVIEYLREHPPAVKPLVLVVTAYADQRFKTVDPDIVAGVLRKPFEVADLGNLIRLCARGFDQALSTRLTHSRDQSIREFVQQHYQTDKSDGSERRTN